MSNLLGQLLPISTVETLVHLKQARIYALVSKGEMPAPIKVGSGKNVWVASELEEWLQSRVAARDAKAAA